MKPQMNDPKHARKYFADELLYTCGPWDLDGWIKEKDKITIIDVRPSEDYEKGHIPGALSLPKEKWSTFQGLEKGKLNVVYCYDQTCHLSIHACLEFAEDGYSVMRLEGGFEAWEEAGFAAEKKELAGAR